MLGIASAATFGDFDYTDDGSSVTITGYAAGAPTDVVIPAQIDAKPVTAIADGVFFYRTELTSVSIPDTVTTIGGNAFLYCFGLTSVTLPSSLETIGTQAFAYCSLLTNLTIPTGVTEIEGSVFTYCSGLQTVTFQGMITSIGESAFSFCSGLQNFVIPSTVTSIGARAFQNCSGLANVTIPPGLAILNDYTFAGCTGMQSVTIPPSVTSMGYQVFINCTSLTSLTITAGSPGLSSIGAQAFFNCTGLTSLTIPATVTSIGDKAFYYCSSLMEAFFTGNAPSAMGVQVFDGTATGFTVYRLEAATGFDVAPWDGYDLGILTSDPLVDWLTANGLPADSDLLSDDNGDGVNLLMAYALNLNPHVNQSRSLPQTVFSAGQMSLSYLEATDDVIYVVETSTDMVDWGTEGVVLSELDEITHIRTATVARTGPQRFMRLSVSR